MGCSTAPTVTVTWLPSAFTTGTCFSTAASVVPGTISVIFWPQHMTGTPLDFTKVIMFPQCSQT